ncbi:MAG: hypothetical protein PVH61_30940 [Candidatus Aminicenantes bacterium]|jgi:hypothetical protein
MERVVKTIRFPADVLKQMRPIMNQKKMNFTAFVIEAIKNYIRMLKYKDGINTSFGAWRDDEHPELKNGVNHYIREMRKPRTS